MVSAHAPLHTIDLILRKKRDGGNPGAPVVFPTAEGVKAVPFSALPPMGFELLVK